MVAQASPLMADDPRALLTGREREILLNNGEGVSEKYYYVVVTRVRKRIKQLESDLPALESHDSLADELRGVVCEHDDFQEPQRQPESAQEPPQDASPSVPPIDTESGPYDDINAKVVEAVRQADNHVSRAKILEYVEEDLDIKPASWWEKHGQDALKDAGAEYTHNKGWKLEGEDA